MDWCCVYLGVYVVGCGVSLVEIQKKLWCVPQVMSGKGEWFGLILPKEMRDAIEKMKMPNKRVYTDMDNEETSQKQANKQGIFYLLLLRILFSLSYSFAS